MNVIFGRGLNETKHEPDRITIEVGDVSFNIHLNNVGELTIQKIQFGGGESSLVIKPSVSNEIRIT